jgi:multiple sugar transport system ATP-binding protein
MYRPYAGKNVILGIRPEHVHDPNYQPANIVPASIDANVDIVEQMGNEKIVYLEEGGKTFLSRMDPRTTASVGQRIQVVVDTGNIHLFDAQTEKALQ